MEYVSPTIITKSKPKKDKKGEKIHKISKEMKMASQNDSSKSNDNKLDSKVITQSYETNSIESCDNMDIKPFDILNKIDDNRREIINEMHLSENRLEERLRYLEQKIDSVNDKIIERYKFWIGISVPAIISIVGIIVTILYR